MRLEISIISPHQILEIDMKKIVFLFAAFGLLAGCGESHHDKAWYATHEKERAEKVTACNNDAAIRATPDCENAINADQDKKAFGNLDDVKTPDFSLKQ